MESGQVNRDEAGRAYGSREAAEGWRRGAATRAQATAVATETMLNMADIVSGSRVLDVAAGTGEQTILAARRGRAHWLGAGHRHRGGDANNCRRAAHQAGLSNVTTHVMDARHADVDAESFDAAICRLGLMFIPDLPDALAGIRRALRSGGKFATIVVSSAEKNPYVALPLEIACRRGRRPVAALDRIGLFSLGSPAVLQTVFTNAGFCNVTVQVYPRIDGIPRGPKPWRIARTHVRRLAY